MRACWVLEKHLPFKNGFVIIILKTGFFNYNYSFHYLPLKYSNSVWHADLLPVQLVSVVNRTKNQAMREKVNAPSLGVKMTELLSLMQTFTLHLKEIHNIMEGFLKFFCLPMGFLSSQTS